jgi:hypothetical protein
MSREQHIKKLINYHSLRLQKLKERKALEGLSVDPGILIEIQNIEDEIDELKFELKELETINLKVNEDIQSKPLQTSHKNLTNPNVITSTVEKSPDTFSQVSLVINKKESFIERLPIKPGIKLVEIQFGIGSTKTKVSPNDWNTDDILPRSFDDGELKWKFRTKKIVDLVNPLMVPRDVDLIVQCREIGSQISVYAAVDEFYKLGVDVASHQHTIFRQCRIGRAGILEFISFTKNGEPIPIRNNVHPYVLGAGQGALNLLVIVEEKDGEIARSPYYPVVRQGIIRPEDFWQHNGQCFVSPDYSRIVFQSISPEGNRSSVFTCKIDGTDLRHVAGAIDTSVALRSVSTNELGGWKSIGRLLVFVKNAANDSWEPHLLEDCDNAYPAPC